MHRSLCLLVCFFLCFFTVVHANAKHDIQENVQRAPLFYTLFLGLIQVGACAHSFVNLVTSFTHANKKNCVENGIQLNRGFLLAEPGTVYSQRLHFFTPHYPIHPSMHSEAKQTAGTK